jgi:hypothetical protein
LNLASAGETFSVRKSKERGPKKHEETNKKEMEQGMKTTNIITIIALSSAIVTPAFATTEANINITATVASVCEFSAVTGAGIDPTQPIILAVATNGTHEGMAEATGATTRAMRLSCNQPFVINLESEQGAVRRLSLANGGTEVDTAILGGSMAKAIGYSATPRLTNLDTAVFTPAYTTLVANQDLLLGAAPANKPTALNVVRTDTAGENSGGAYDGTLEIGIATEASPTLVSGNYRDTLRVILIAQ